jgi:hypothetical protein
MTPLEAYALRREKGNLLRIAVGSTQNLLEIIRECDVMLAVTDDSIENREVLKLYSGETMGMQRLASMQLRVTLV